MKADAREWLRGRRPRGYVRESTKRQGKDDRYGPRVQISAQREASEHFGMQDLSAFYTDLVSGRSVLKRSEFQRMIADAKARAFDVLLVYDVSRFARNETDAWVYLDALRDAGVPVYFCDEDILTIHDEDWRERVGSVINAAATFSAKLARNVKRGLARKRAAGGHVGPVPWGYRRAGETVVADPETAPQRALFFELYATGEYTFRTLSLELGSRGVRIAGRIPSVVTVQTILTNPIVVGNIVEPETWDRVVAVRARNAWARRKIGQRRHTYLFAGVARCGVCGERYYGRTNARGDREVMHAPRGCGRGGRTERKLARLMGEWLDGWRLAANARVRIVAYMRSREPVAAAEHLARRTQLEAEAARLQNLYRWGDLTEADFLRERTRVRTALTAMPVAAAATEPDPVALSLVDRIGEAWRSASDEVRTRFVEEWLAELRLFPDGSIEVLPRAPYVEMVCAATEDAAAPSIRSTFAPRWTSNSSSSGSKRWSSALGRCP